tara:strand:- start:3343 stop:3756 length:414 start_codon:yes stop_codon:yes gene_type:complete
MLNLSRKDEIITIKLKGAKINCKPYMSEHRAIAKLKASKEVSELIEQRKSELEQGVDSKLPNFDNIEVQNGIFISIFNTELAKQVIIDWSGIGSDNKELPVTDNNIELLMTNGALNIQEEFIKQYMELQTEVEEEKK